MSRNSKNARLHAQARALPKNRSAAAKARRASGEVRQPGRATSPSHGKKNAWWQNGDYATFVKGKQKRGKRTETAETAEE